MSPLIAVIHYRVNRVRPAYIAMCHVFQVSNRSFTSNIALLHSLLQKPLPTNTTLSQLKPKNKVKETNSITPRAPSCGAALPWRCCVLGGDLRGLVETAKTGVHLLDGAAKRGARPAASRLRALVRARPKCRGGGASGRGARARGSSERFQPP